MLKIAQIIPIYKSADKQDCTNYRPISILSTFSKIFEKMINTRIYDYLEKFELLYKHQYAFRRGHSTNLALSALCNELVLNTDKGLLSCCISLDLSKAFDTVNHNILISKMEKNFGIRGLPLQLFQSYLNNRFQYTIINGEKSTLRPVRCGIPQGSTLGTLLFLMHINDLPLATSFKVSLFADDTTFNNG